MITISAWVISLRRRGVNPILSNVKLAKIFSFDNDLTLEDRGEMMASDEFNALERMCGVTTPSECRNEIDLIVQELANLDPKLYIRGKFEMWFFVKFIERLEEVLRRAISNAGGNMSVKLQITEGNAIEILGPKLQFLPSLEEFLRNNVGTY